MPTPPLHTRIANLLRKGWRLALLCALITGGVAAAVIVLRVQGVLQRTELFFYDQFVTQIPAGDVARPRVVIVEVTADDIRPLEEGGMGYPISDDHLAQLLEKILAQRPRAVGIDLIRDRKVEPSNGRLEQILASNPNVVLVYTLDYGARRGDPALPPFDQEPQRIGFADVPADPGDGNIRRASLVQPRRQTPDGDEYGVSLAFRLAQLGLGLPFDPEPVALGEYELARLDPDVGPFVLRESEVRSAQVLIDFAANEQIQSHRYPAGRLLQGLDAPPFGGAVVIIGQTAYGDFHQTPLHWNTPGVVNQANITDQLMRLAQGQSPIGSWSERGEWVYTLAWSLGGGLAALAAVSFRSIGKQRRSLLDATLREMRFFLVLLVVGIVAIWLIGRQALLARFFVPVVPPIFAYAVSANAVMLYAYFRERQARQLERAFMGMYVPKAVLEKLLANQADLLRGQRLPPEQMPATALFADLEGFSTQAEAMRPAQVERWINDYLREMAEAIIPDEGRPSRGYVKQFRGDQVVALFGPPFKHEGNDVVEDTRQAVDSAIRMRHCLARLNSVWAEKGRQPLRMRIGICTGEVMTGTVGGGGRVEYDVFGDAINTAARLENWEKHRMEPAIAPGGCRILIAGATRRLVGDFYDLVDLGPQPLRGKNQTVQVYAVLGRRRSPSQILPAAAAGSSDGPAESDAPHGATAPGAGMRGAATSDSEVVQT